MYKVKVNFTDLTDNNYAYKAGEIFPRRGLIVSQARLNELSGTNNKRGISLIELVNVKAVNVSDEPETKDVAPRKKSSRKKANA